MGPPFFHWWLILSLVFFHRAAGLSSSPTASSKTTTSTEVVTTSSFDWPKITGSILKGERRALERDTGLRETCSGCSRPHTLCLCSNLPSPKLVTSTRVLILQHPNERRKRNLSTTPLLQLALEKCVVKVGYDFDATILDEFPDHRPLLLYPSDDAVALDDDDIEFGGGHVDMTMTSTDTNDSNTQQHHPHKKNLLLILIDGTWAEAKRMLRESLQLVQECQAVKFTSVDQTSIYDVLRKEPQPHCLSTLEACSKALQYLEATNVQTTLHDLLKTHVDAHLANKRQMQQQPRYVNRGGGRHVPQTRQEQIQERMAQLENEDKL